MLPDDLRKLWLAIHLLENENELIEEYQSAYRVGHSTESALLKVQNDALRTIDDNNCVILLMLDLSAAFDTVNHELLLRRLEDRFGVKGNALRWFKSYFSGRKQFVSIGKDRSLSRTLKFGLPQGSMLGPLLYSL